MKKPFKDEIVKGTDNKGNKFQEGRVLDSSKDESRIRLQDGSDTYASHSNLKGQIDHPRKPVSLRRKKS